MGNGLSAALCAAAALTWFVTNRHQDTLTTCLFILAGLVAVSCEAWLAWSGGSVYVQGAICLATSGVAAASLWRARVSGNDPALSTGTP